MQRYYKTAIAAVWFVNEVWHPYFCSMENTSNEQEPKRVTGIGGIFFKSENPAALNAWYKEHLGMNTTDYGTTFTWRKEEKPEEKGYTLWTPFKKETSYFAPSTKEFMVNLRVENIEWLVGKLKEEGVTVLDEIENSEYGKFVHILDHEGNKVELWEDVDRV